MIPCIAVVGPGDNAAESAIADAIEVGRLVAARGWALLTGGRDAGVMRAATTGAALAGGITIGILPGTDKSGAVPELQIALATGLGEARNAVLVTAADVVIACGVSTGTASEVALALRIGKPTILVRPDSLELAFFSGIAAPLVAETPRAAIELASTQLL